MAKRLLGSDSKNNNTNDDIVTIYYNSEKESNTENFQYLKIENQNLKLELEQLRAQNLDLKVREQLNQNIKLDNQNLKLDNQNLKLDNQNLKLELEQLLAQILDLRVREQLNQNLKLENQNLKLELELKIEELRAQLKVQNSARIEPLNTPKTKQTNPDVILLKLLPLDDSKILEIKATRKTKISKLIQVQNKGEDASQISGLMLGPRRLNPDDLLGAVYV